MPLIKLSSKWYEHCIFSSAGIAATVAITDTKLYVPVVTLKVEDNAKLSKLISAGFKRSVYCNKYKITFEDYHNEYIRERLDTSFQGVNKLFVLAYASADNVTNENSYRRYFLPRREIKVITLKLMVDIFMINQLMT